MTGFDPGLIDIEFHPGINRGMNSNWTNREDVPAPSLPKTYTAFQKFRLFATGSLAEVAVEVKGASKRSSSESVLIFDDATGREIDVDTRGSEKDVRARYAAVPVKPTASDASVAPVDQPAQARGPGRPKLGVVAREVTLLPRHWEWLNDQPGGASVALRKLVEEARRTSGPKDRERRARDAAYHFMSSMCGNFENFEEATRALYAGDITKLRSLTRPWPEDVRTYALRLAGVASRSPK